MADTLKTILVVEDQVETAEMFVEMLRLSGYEASFSDNSQEALQIITESVPDAMLLDVMMPGVSGLETLRQMRGELGLTDLPVIIVSAKGLPSDIKDGKEAGATAYLTKPISFMDLKQAVKDALRES